jgi:hypothetical protein
MKRFYHITPIKNIPSILTLGIIPDKGIGFVGGRYLSKSYRGYTFLTDNPKYIIETQLTPQWCECATIVLVMCELECKPWREHEYVTTEIINPEKLVVDTELFKMLCKSVYSEFWSS